MRTTILLLGASLLAAVSLASPAFAQSPTTKVAAATTTGAFSSVEGLTCRGYYNQSEGGQGSLARPETAFKTTKVENGHFIMTSANAKPGASRGWDTASGNNYLRQGETEFKLQPDGSWLFLNPLAQTKYYLTAVASSDPKVKKFTVRYEPDTGSGWAVGRAECRE